MLNLKIITSTNRPGRKGPAIAKWILDIAQKNNKFNTQLLDLAEINLPFMDEPNHPSTQQYTKEHTKKWAKQIDEADAFIFVLAEYNHGYPAVLKNALDYLFHEWGRKPAGFVSYGGVAAGTRSLQQLKTVLASMKVVPMVEVVNIPMFQKHLDKDGNFNGDEEMGKAANAMLKEMEKWADTLKTMRG